MGKEGLKLARRKIYDVVILDVMLPKMSGLEILAKLRADKINTPVIILSALAEVEDKVQGLDLGADDYLPKPFKTAELLARLNALVRRPPEIRSDKLQYADLVYDFGEKELNGVRLTEKEAKIMEMLLKSPEKIVNRDYLRAHVWGLGIDNDGNSLEVYISRLRKKLTEMGSAARIVSIRNMGYKIERSKDV